MGAARYLEAYYDHATNRIIINPDYEGTVSVVLDMIRLLESQFEDIPSSGFNPEIEAMRNAVRCADYDSAIVLAEAYYQSRQVPSGDESQQRLIDIAIERLQPAAS